ncbi:antitoxin VapB family protein [Halovenus marina]|uniref:antitoxin VapB family protein n=1 Tax=Halovenus marina TaxID=3396621 RepID=UPI003F54FF26
MSNYIEVSDEVYERLKRKKGDRSFSEVIAAHLDDGKRHSDVAGAQILATKAYREASEEITQLSEGEFDCIREE